MRKTLCKLTLACLFLTTCGCSADIKDAAMVGVTDYVSASITETLMALLPVSKLVTQSRSTAASQEEAANQEAAD